MIKTPTRRLVVILLRNDLADTRRERAGFSPVQEAVSLGLTELSEPWEAAIVVEVISGLRQGSGSLRG
jgi:hypothetical protein